MTHTPNEAQQAWNGKRTRKAKATRPVEIVRVELPPVVVAPKPPPVVRARRVVVERSDNLEWIDRANCVGLDVEAFYPTKGESVRAAKKVCGRCEVADQCLAWALANGERHGVWGNASERERRRMHRRGAA